MAQHFHKRGNPSRFYRAVNIVARHKSAQASKATYQTKGK